MAVVPVEVENASGQVVRFLVEEDGEQHEYLRKQLRRDDLRRVEVLKPAARKPATTK